jgi:hypothetical protein
MTGIGLRLLVTAVLLTSASCTSGDKRNGESPFGIFGPFEYALDDPTVATEEQIIACLTDLGVPWVQEMYFTAAVPEIPQSINIYSRVGAEGGAASATCLALDDPAWTGYEQNYASALRTTVAEWKDRIQYFEVATEPGGFEPPRGWKNCERNYVEHMKTTYEAVKQECPECKVVYGGLSGVYINFDETFDSAQFLDKTLAAGAGDYFDVFEFKQHAYRALDYPELRNKFEVYSRIFKKYGLDLGRIPVFVETAMYDGDPCMAWQGSLCTDTFDLPYQSETEQAAGLVKTYLYGAASGIDRIFWNLIIERYNFSGNPTNAFNMYGLVNNPRNDGKSSKKLAYFTYKKMVEKLAGCDWSSLQAIQEQDGVYVYRMQKAGKPVWIAWNDNASAAVITFTSVHSSDIITTEAVPAAASGAEVTDYTTAFTIKDVVVSNGTATISLGVVPVFVEER